MGDTYPQVRVAAVQAAPVFLDREATTEKVCRLIRQAGSQGASLVAFPESFIPGHPLWYHFHAATSKHSLALAAQLQRNAVTVPGPEVEALCAAARAADAYVVVGITEKEPESLGSMYNTQLFIDRRGHVLGVHRKLTPTLGERLVHRGGDGSSLRTFPTDFGPIGGLICGENSNPLASFALASMGMRLLVASWPSHFSRHTHPMCDVVGMAAQFVSYSAGCFVVSSVGAISDEMRQVLPCTDEDRAFLEANTGGGGSRVTSAMSRTLAGPLPPGEDILYADLDFGDIATAKLAHDFTGHYNRPDVFTLKLNQGAPRLFEARGAGEAAVSDPLQDGLDA